MFEVKNSIYNEKASELGIPSWNDTFKCKLSANDDRAVYHLTRYYSPFNHRN